MTAFMIIVPRTSHWARTFQSPLTMPPTFKSYICKDYVAVISPFQMEKKEKLLFGDKEYSVYDNFVEFGTFLQIIKMLLFLKQDVRKEGKLKAI